MADQDETPPLVDGLAAEFELLNEELRYSKSLLECQAESALDGILVVSPEGKLVSFNRQFVKMWQVPESVVESRSNDVGMSHAATLLRDPDAFRATLRRLLEEKELVTSGEFAFKDGRVLEWQSEPVRRTDGNDHRFVLFRDVTKQRRSEREIRRL